jgi:CHAD domain-containing protein
MGEVVERERKYEVSEDGRVPALEDVEGVRDVSDPERDRLDAVYFDTPDLRLARAGGSLRRRTGGPDEGWHLKLPAGPDSRMEYHARLDDADHPPRELIDLIAGILRGAEPAPIAQITTNRRRRRLLDRNGRVLAEVTDDLVSGKPRGAKAVGWREVEVELAERTDSRMLDTIEEHLLRSGLRRSASGSKLGRVLEVEPDHPDPLGAKSNAGEAVLAYLRGQVTIMNQQDVQVRRGGDDAVHRLRVAARRIRSTLRVFGRIVDRERTGDIEAELRWLGRKLGPARDLEVLEERLRGAVAELPDEWVLGAVNTRLTRHFTPARADADRAAVRTLNTTRYFRLRDRLDELLAAPPLTGRAQRRARKVLPRQVRRAYRKVDRRVDTMTATPPGPSRDTATHRVRKAAKRLRYATEVAVPAVGKPANRTRKRAKAFTSILGEFQDGVVALAPLRQLGISAHQGGDNGFTFGVLAGQERATRRALDHDIWAAWDRLSAKKSRRWLG